MGALCGKANKEPPKEKQKTFAQTLVICRHSERCDFEDPSYKDTDEYKAFPFDTSITPRGVELAKQVGKELEELHRKTKFAMVVSSPYRRCLQTASEITQALRLPVIIDQEIGEVWAEDMPSDRPPHRTPLDLKTMAAELGLDVQNPLRPEDGGIKLFGNRPKKWPETVKDGHMRCIVRIEHYIEQSNKTRQNFIIVSHAPAVAAMMDIFEHGMIDVAKLDYCARVIASRSLSQEQAKNELKHDRSVFKEQWTVDHRGLEVDININGTEEKHDAACHETEEMRANRFQHRTKTDVLLNQTIKQQKASASKDGKQKDDKGNGSKDKDNRV